MIRVFIELLPGGSALRKKTIARFDVWNMSDLAPISNYGWEAEILRMEGKVEHRNGTIAEHDRSRGALELVRRLMVEADTQATNSRESVATLDEKNIDLSSHLLMLAMTVESTTTDPKVLAIAAKAREALERSGK